MPSNFIGAKCGFAVDTQNLFSRHDWVLRVAAVEHASHASDYYVSLLKLSAWSGLDFAGCLDA
jgi:hypothetical protein